MKSVLTLLLFLNLALHSFLWAQSKQALEINTLVITHITVIDATGAPAKSDMSVVISGDRITALGKASQVRTPKGAQVVDATGKYLIPGLWDMHVHTLWRDWFETFFPMFIANGITSVRDMYGDLERLTQLRNEQALGKLLAPRVVASGPIVDGPEPVWPGSISVSNESEARQAVTSLKQRGVDFIKVYTLLPRDAYLALANEAKKQGIPFAGHVPHSVGAAEASDAGQRSIDHLSDILLACSTDEAELRAEMLEARMNPKSPIASQERTRARLNRLLDTYSEAKATDLFARFVRNGTWQCPTLTQLRGDTFIEDGNFTNDSRLKYIPPSVKEIWDPRDVRAGYRMAVGFDLAKREFQKQLEVVGAMRRAGVEFLAGTDTPNPYCFPGFSLHDELALLVDAGLTPIEALQSATLGPAKYLGKLDSLGTVESGKIADLVLLDANPLEDIRNIQKINTVIIGGRLISPSERQEMLAGVEATTNQRASGWFIDMLVSHMIESAMVVVLLTIFLPLYLYYRQKRRRVRSLREP